LDPQYDRSAAARILGTLAASGLFAATELGAARRIGYTASALTPEPGARLTLSQRLYLERFMAPCGPDHITSATHRMTWTDSEGIPNTGHYGPSELGPIVPIAAREAVLALWRGLAANTRLAQAALELSDDDLDVLAATTTDQEPMEIFRIGVEAAGRALTQHALIAHHTSFRTPAVFASQWHRSGMFATVASSWYWELQASTYRRGMIPVALERDSDIRMRYTAQSGELLAAMKRRTIDDAHETMRRAMTVEGLTAAQAVRKYHTDLDLISRQYALLEPGTQPRCLALTPNTEAGRRVTVLSMAADALVAAFLRLLDLVEIRQVPAVSPAEDGTITDADRRFHVPDMNCKHCRITIAAVLESHGVEVADINLVTKQVVAQFDTLGIRETAFAAIRDAGYTVIGDGGPA
jgi:copper chaperone CopZ